MKNEVSVFKRVIGTGIAANVDVSKRIQNFNGWFILFTISFLLFWFWMNDLLQKKKSQNALKIISFTDHFIVLANCSLLLRCITYFQDNRSAMNVTFYFSSEVIQLLMLVVLVYVLMGRDRTIDADVFAQMLFIVGAVSYPIAIFTALELEEGRAVLGVMMICILFILLLCKFATGMIQSVLCKNAVMSSVLILSLVPLVTSAFIEFVHVLNQYSIFLAHPSWYYFVVLFMIMLGVVALGFLFQKRAIRIRNWKRWSYPWYVFGITCLSVQIPIQSTYSPDLFEGANYSILISDYLNFGKIPIVEHYGGHMMTGVWEGILYGILNQDPAGAVVSPYSFLVTPFLTVLFYYLIKNVWNEDLALLTTILFPFMGVWSYYGMGMLVCCAAMAYVKKNSYFRAEIIWCAFIWCAFYRLDMGFAFGSAVIISLAIYVVLTRNMNAVKELCLTLSGSAAIGMAVWCLICIVKGIHPINRLFEFLMINMSNQNWAYAGIGDSNNSMFSFSYMMIPFLAVLCLMYTVLSKNMREQIGFEKWMILLVFGFSYMTNFSRGLVRHSLGEGLGAAVIWSSYLFLALFFCCYKKNPKLFLPAFMAFILFSALLSHPGNYRSTAIADTAMSIPSRIIESWRLSRFDKEEYDESKFMQDKLIARGETIDESDQLYDRPISYWQKLKYDQEVVKRVQLNDDLQNTMRAYELVLKTILDENETFVDFMNRTLIYSLIGKENPVYVSQSPLQLSGEFTQKQFVEEIQNIPVILMPIDPYNDHASNTLDGIANTYRNYKVSEYIYQNYVPLCQYENLFAVWCLRDEEQKYREKVKGLVNEKQICTMVSYDTESAVCEIQNMIDTSAFVGMNMLVRVGYTIDLPGMMSLQYTTEKGEEYTAQKSVSVEVQDTGTAEFVIPVTEYTKCCLHVPENSKMVISSLSVSHTCKYIDYGYDGPVENVDGNGVVSYGYISALHHYDIGQIPRIWAASDTKNSVNNQVLAELQYCDGIYTFEPKAVEVGENGNYLKISAVYEGDDTQGFYQAEDETLPVTVLAGWYEDGRFSEKCRYTFLMTEGMHEYLIRISSDYYWHLKEINAFQIQTNGVLQDLQMQILEGERGT